MYGKGVYLTRFRWSWMARLQRARSTEAVIEVVTKGRTIKSTPFPGTFRHIGDLFLN